MAAGKKSVTVTLPIREPKSATVRWNRTGKGEVDKGTPGKDDAMDAAYIKNWVFNEIGACPDGVKITIEAA